MPRLEWLNLCCYVEEISMKSFKNFIRRRVGDEAIKKDVSSLQMVQYEGVRDENTGKRVSGLLKSKASLCNFAHGILVAPSA